MSSLSRIQKQAHKHHLQATPVTFKSKMTKKAGQKRKREGEVKAQGVQSKKRRFNGSQHSKTAIEREPSAASSQTLGRPSKSPIKKESFVSTTSLKPLSETLLNSSVPAAAATEASIMAEEKEPNDSIKNPTLFAKTERAHLLKECLAKATVGGSDDVTIPIRILIVATPTLREFWDPKRHLRVRMATPETPEQPPRPSAPKQQQQTFTSFASMMEHVDAFINAFGKTPPVTKPRFAPSFDKVTRALQKHARILTNGGLAVVNGKRQWASKLQEAKLKEELLKEVKVFICVGNGRLLGDGTVVEFEK